MVGKHTLDKLDELLLKSPPSPPLPADPKTVALNVIDDPTGWVRDALSTLQASSSVITTLGFVDPNVGAALDHHFHMSSLASNLTELNFIIDRYKDILDLLTKEKANPSVFRSVSDAQAMKDENCAQNDIAPAYTFNRNLPNASINFTSVYVGLKDDCMKVSIIHECMHFVEPNPGPGLPDIGEWDSARYNDRTLLPVTGTIHNPSSYAAGAFELATGNDRRDFCR